MREGEYLKRTRSQKGFTQEDIANLIQVKRTTYAAYEQGRIRVPLEVFAKLANVYGTTLEMMIKEVGNITDCSDYLEQEEKLLKYYQQSNQKKRKMIKDYIAFVSKKK